LFGVFPEPRRVEIMEEENARKREE